jgi:signal transduction histidine kinase
MEQDTAAAAAPGRALDHLIQLQRVTAALASAIDASDVARVVVEHGVAACGAQAGLVCVFTGDHGHLEIIASRGYPPEAVEPFHRLKVSSNFPLSRAAKTGRPLWIESREAFTPSLPFPFTDSLAWAALPLRVGGDVLGVLGLSFTDPQQFAEEDRVFMMTLADLSAQALHRAYLYREAESQRQRLQDLFMHAHAGIIVTSGPDHVVDFCNLMFRDRLAGRDIEGRPVREALPELEGQGFFEMMDGVYLSGEPFVGRELPASLHWSGTQDPSVRYFHTVVQPVRDPRGAIEGTMVLVLDVSRQVRARAEIEQLAAERAATLQHLAEGLLIVDRSGTVTYMNDAARAMIGRDVAGTHVDEARTSPFVKAPSGDPYTPAQMAVVRALEHGETARNINVRINRGSDFLLVESTISPIVGQDTGRLGAVVLMRDVTRERLLEQQKDDFLSAAAHDLKTPLTIIHGLVQLLERRVSRGEIDPDTVAEHLSRILRTTTKMSGMINSLLDLTRLQVDKPLELDLRPVDLVELVRQITAEQQNQSRRHRVVFKTESEQIVGRWDQGRLERAIANLVTNAIRYSPHGGDVIVTLQEQGSDAVISIEDSGLGIPSGDLPHIFDRFYRGSNVQSRIDGAGIGLAGVRQVVDQHGGTIEVDTQEGKGSTFTVRLPAREPESPEP